MKKYLTDLISKEEVLGWKNGYYSISAQTGTGKTTLILEHAYSPEHKILVISNRKYLNKQISKKLENQKKNDSIDTITYQSLCNYANLSEMMFYRYIFFDEAASIFCDSQFSDLMENMLEIIEYLKDFTTCVFMSATLEVHMSSPFYTKSRADFTVASQKIDTIGA